MKPFKLPYFILTAGIFILVLSTLLGSSIISKYGEINGSYKTDKVLVNVLSDSASLGRSAFTMDDIRNLKDFSFKDTDMAVASVKKSIVSYKESQTQAELYGVNDRYSMFHQIQLKSGSFITQKNKDENVAVVDESLAQELFNNNNVVGMNVKLYNKEFRIIGVIAHDDSILHTLTDSGVGRIYVPVDKMLEYDKNSKITSFEVRADGDGITGQNISNVETALASIGKNASSYKIMDFKLENIMVAQKASINIFIAGAGAITILLLLIKKRVVDTYINIKSGLEKNYFRDVLRLKYVNLCLTALEIAAMLMFAYVIWNSIKFNLYLPPEFVPDELIDTNFFYELFKSLIQVKVQSAGYVATFTEMKINTLGMMQDWNLCIGLLTGFPLYFLGLKLLEPKEEDSVKHLLYCCIIFVLSIISGVLVLAVLKMPATVNIKGVSVILVFIFLSISRMVTHTTKLIKNL